MRLYRKDAKGIIWAGKHREAILNALVMWPLIIGIIGEILFKNIMFLTMGLLMFVGNIPIMLIVLVTIDLCYAKYLNEKSKMEGSGI